MSRLAGLAAQFGVAGLGGDDPSQSPDFYADLLTSPTVLRQIAGRQYVIPIGGDTLRGGLADIFELSGATDAIRTEAAVRRLRVVMGVGTNFKTSVVSVTVSTRSPVLSKAIADTALSLVNAFNLERRREQAARERAFVEERVDSARQDLRGAEDRMQSFLQQNREYRAAPALQLQHDRLDRELQVKTQVYQSLLQNYEQSRIEEVRNVPLIAAVETPVVAARADSRRLVLKAILALVAGLGAGAALALLAEFLSGARNLSPRESDALRGLWTETRTDLARPWRLFRH